MAQGILLAQGTLHVFLECLRSSPTIQLIKQYQSIPPRPRSGGSELDSSALYRRLGEVIAHIGHIPLLEQRRSTVGTSF